MNVLEYIEHTGTIGLIKYKHLNTPRASVCVKDDLIEIEIKIYRTTALERLNIVLLLKDIFGKDKKIVFNEELANECDYFNKNTC